MEGNTFRFSVKKLIRRKIYPSVSVKLEDFSFQNDIYLARKDFLPVPDCCEPEGSGELKISIFFHLQVIVFTAVKNCSILHRRVIVMTDLHHSRAVLVSGMMPAVSSAERMPLSVSTAP